MRFRNSLASLFAIAQVTSAIPQAVPRNVKRQASQLLDSYDFVIAGGGTSGLTLADRLTEAFPDSLLSFTWPFAWMNERLTDNCFRASQRISLSSSMARLNMQRAPSTRP
jgi:hypothetical protein